RLARHFWERTSMHVLITGAGGMIGRKLAQRIVRDGHIGGRAISLLTLADIAAPMPPQGADAGVVAIAADISRPEAAQALLAGKPDIVFHLAAVVSGEAEADFDKGYAVNFDGTRWLFEAMRALAYRPRVVFASSIAVFGAPFPDRIDDEFLSAPLTSYG